VTVRTGGRSRTVTVKVQLLALVLLSRAMQRTSVAPAGKTEPDAGVHVTVGLG